MNNGVAPPEGCTDIQTFVRNRYFYGKLLDVDQFEMEQEYFNKKRWLLNRLVTGYGVICGLNVELIKDREHIRVGPGVALDKAGREIVVPVHSKPIAIREPHLEPAGKSVDTDDNTNVRSVYISYHDCPGEPEQIRASDCDEPAQCSTGSIRERYQIKILQGKVPDIDLYCKVPDLVKGDRIDYDALVKYVTSYCPEKGTNSGIALANIHLPKPHEPPCDPNIDISVRPIVYTNDLLFKLIVRLTQKPGQWGGKL